MIYKFLLLIFAFILQTNCADEKGAKEPHKFLIHQTEQEKQEHEKEIKAIHAHLYSLGFPHEIASLIIEYAHKYPEEEVEEKISEFINSELKATSQGHGDYSEQDLKKFRDEEFPRFKLFDNYKKIKLMKYIELDLKDLNFTLAKDPSHLHAYQHSQLIDKFIDEWIDDNKIDWIRNFDDLGRNDPIFSIGRLKRNRFIDDNFGINIPNNPALAYLVYKYLYLSLDKETIKENQIKDPQELKKELDSLKNILKVD